MEALDAEERESRESRGRPRAAHTAPTFIDRTFRGRSATLTCCRVCHEVRA